MLLGSPQQIFDQNLTINQLEPSVGCLRTVSFHFQLEFNQKSRERAFEGSRSRLPEIFGDSLGKAARWAEALVRNRLWLEGGLSQRESL